MLCVTRGFINKNERWHAYTVLVPSLVDGGPVPILLYPPFKQNRLITNKLITYSIQVACSKLNQQN